MIENKSFSRINLKNRICNNSEEIRTSLLKIIEYKYFMMYLFLDILYQIFVHFEILKIKSYDMQLFQGGGGPRLLIISRFT